MSWTPRRLVIAALLAVWPALASAQVIIIPRHPHPVPPIPRPTPVFSDYRIKQVETQVVIKDQAATVQIAQVFQNTGSSTLEATFAFPMPDDAAIGGVTLLVDGKELTGKLMKKEEARKIYEEIVRRNRDPALLEYLGRGLFQTSVFPIPAQAERRVEVRYTQLLRKDNGLIDLVLPLGTNKHSNKPVDSLTTVVRIEANDAIKTVYSPTHKLDIERPDDKHATCKLTLNNVANPDDFRLFYATQEGLLGMNVLTYRPDPKDDGYFLLLASPEIKTAKEESVPKTVVVIIDRSGSMSGPKIQQAKDALKFVIQQLKSGDTFNIIAYDSVVETFRPELQRADEATIKAALGFADGLFAGGSTNIDGALQTGLKLLTDKSRPSYVLFLTDGLPTVGELNEQSIAKNAAAANGVNARLFSFGVGYDVNSRLLDRLSHDQRGQSVYVKPNENIEAHVASLYQKIGSPLMTDLSLTFDFDNKPAEGAPAVISRTYPKPLTDLFRGEQLVLVGRYRQTGAAKVTLGGSIVGEKRSFTFPANFVEKSADESHGFVEKLWATRRVGEIIDELDLKGRNQELIDELVALSIKHGILTPYTSFLADETNGIHTADRGANRRAADEQLRKQLEANVSGEAGFAQRALKGEYKNAPAAGAAAPSGKGGAVYAQDALGKSREVATVRNLGQKTFFQKKNQWRDSSVTEEQEKSATQITQFSDEYFKLANDHGGQLSKYLVFTEPVLVNIGDKTYQINPPQDEPQPE